MKLKTVGPLKKSYHSWGFPSDPYAGNFLCNGQLRRYFNVPENAKTLWVEFHDRPAKDRLRVRLGPTVSRLRMGDYGRSGYFMYQKAWLTVNDLVKGKSYKSVYAEVYYKT